MRSGRPGGVGGGHKGSAGRPCVCPEGRGEVEGAPRDVQQPTAFSPFLPNLPQSWVFIFWILAKINKQINVQQEVGPQLHPGGGGGGQAAGRWMRWLPGFRHGALPSLESAPAGRLVWAAFGGCEGPRRPQETICLANGGEQTWKQQPFLFKLLRGM